jgi:hypothetical protein
MRSRGKPSDFDHKLQIAVFAMNDATSGQSNREWITSCAVLSILAPWGDAGGSVSFHANPQLSVP